MRKFIITECYTDTNLVETLVPSIECNHQHGCQAVCSVMQKKFADTFALGIVDKDKRPVAYLKEFDCIAQTNNLYLYKHQSRHHYIIQLCPAVEVFLLNAAQSLNLSLVNCGLPNDLDGLKKLTKSKTSKKDPIIKQAIKELQLSTDMQCLAKWVSYLKQHLYNTDINELVKLSNNT